MLEIGLSDVEVTFIRKLATAPTDFVFTRIGMRGRVSNTPDNISDKMLPRKRFYMPTGPGRGNR